MHLYIWNLGFKFTFVIWVLNLHKFGIWFSNLHAILGFEFTFHWGVLNAGISKKNLLQLILLQ